MKERLQKVIAAAGVGSRRKAEEWIAAGRVSVNGEIASLGMQADAEKDIICIDGKPLAERDDKVYIMLNKPRGYVTTLHDERGRKTVAELVEECGVRVYPIGRLDMDSEGLLLLTNDGALANRVMHPRGEVNKTYLVTVRGATRDTARQLRAPMELDGRPIKPAEVRVLQTDGDRQKLEITIHEGRNRQIRRMCELCGCRVSRLKRIAEGSLTLGDLPMGKWRTLTRAEVAQLNAL